MKSQIKQISLLTLLTTASITTGFAESPFQSREPNQPDREIFIRENGYYVSELMTYNSGSPKNEVVVAKRWYDYDHKTKVGRLFLESMVPFVPYPEKAELQRTIVFLDGERDGVVDVVHQWENYVYTRPAEEYNSAHIPPIWQRISHICTHDIEHERGTKNPIPPDLQRLFELNYKDLRIKEVHNVWLEKQNKK